MLQATAPPKKMLAPRGAVSHAQRAGGEVGEIGSTPRGCEEVGEGNGRPSGSLNA